MHTQIPSIKGLLVVTWAIIGLLILLGFACWRLSAYTIESFSMSLNWMHWVVFIGFTIFTWHLEKAKKVSPRFAARCKFLLTNTTILQLPFAPIRGFNFQWAWASGSAAAEFV